MSSDCRNEPDDTSTWYVYVLRCADQSLYTGVTTDIARRLDEHNHDALKGAKYTRARRPVQLAYSETTQDRSSACTREAYIKKLSRKQKQALIDQDECELYSEQKR